MTPKDWTASLAESPAEPPKISLLTMFQLGLFQVGLGMMSVLPDGVLNRLLIRELDVSPTVASLILAMTLFVAPARVWFGQMSDTKKLWGYHRTGYMWIGITCLSMIAIAAVQVMWQMNDSLQASGWSLQTYAWVGLLMLVFGLYGLAVSASSTPFTTLLVDVSDEDNRSQTAAVNWSMLIGGTIIGAITISSLLKGLQLNASLDEIQANINRLFIIVPLIVIVLAVAGAWGVEKKYSRYYVRSNLGDQEHKITLGRAWRVLTASRQTKIFFGFLLLMTLGLWMQDPVLEPYAGDFFEMGIGASAALQAFWGTGTLIGIVGAGFLIIPRIGKKQGTKLGCLLSAICLSGVILAGFTHKPAVLQLALLIFGLGSGILTSGALTLMLDLTAAETAGTFIGAWGLAQAFARGTAKVAGGAVLDIGKNLFGDANLFWAYSVVFALQAGSMLLAIYFLDRINVQEFRTKAKEAINAVITNDID
jgi:MFS transporter, BCD family, chlorophyll transporter